MPSLFSVLAVAAAALLPSAFAAGVTDCNVNQVTLMRGSDRESLSIVNTDYDVTRYDANVTTSALQSSGSVVFEIRQSADSNAQFTVKLNDETLTSVGSVSNRAIDSTGFDFECGHDNILLVEVTQVEENKNDGKTLRYDSCRFKYEVNYHNVC
jgi:opacity protein-like surface antigen